MIVEAQFSDIDSDGRRAVTRRVNFADQNQQGRYLRALVNVYRNKLPIREKAVEIIRAAGIPPKARAAQAYAIGQWACDHLYYVNERDETFATPLRTIRSGFGDCDDFTSAIGALCEAIGIPTELVCMGVNSWPRLVHIYPRALVPFGKRAMRLPLDATIAPPNGTYRLGSDPVRIAKARGDSVHTRVF